VDALYKSTYTYFVVSSGRLNRTRVANIRCVCVRRVRRDVPGGCLYAGGRAVQLPCLLSGTRRLVADGGAPGDAQRHEGCSHFPRVVSQRHATPAG